VEGWSFLVLMPYLSFQPLLMLRWYMDVIGMHPRVLVDGFDIAKRATLQFLEKFKTPVVMGGEPDKEILKMVARTTVRTKVKLVSFLISFYLKFDHTLVLQTKWKITCEHNFFITHEILTIYFLIICSCMNHSPINWLT